MANPSDSTSSSSSSGPSGQQQPGPFKKFILHIPTLTSPSSLLTSAATGSGPLSHAQISGLRVTLNEVKKTATERLAIKDANKRNLVERQQIHTKAADEAARLKDIERQKKKESDERRERERIERVEREKLERERDEQREKVKQEEEYQLMKVKEEEDKRASDEREREKAVRQAREAKKSKTEEVLKLVRANAVVVDSNDDRHDSFSPAPTATPPPPPSSSTQRQQSQDAVMQDVKPVIPQLDDATPMTVDTPPPPTASSSSKLPPPSTSDPTPSTTTAAPSLPPSPSKPPTSFLPPSITIESSPDGDEDSSQPKPPKHSLDKKRKHDQVIHSDDSNSDDNEDQPLSQKIRRLDDTSPSTRVGSQLGRSNSQTPARTPTPIPVKDPNEGLSLLKRKLKDEKFIKHSIPTKQIPIGTATAFYLPKTDLAPPAPISVAPTSTAKKQSEVSDDFSKSKPGTQITHNAFHTWVEAYLRPFGEDDLAFLAPKPDDITPYLIPPLGKHYTDRWEEEDSDLPLASTSHSTSPLDPPKLQRYRPEALTEDALGMENIYLGPLSERLVAALLFEDEEDVEDEVEERVERPDGAAGAPGIVVKGQTVDAVELEERIKNELKFIGILGEEDVDWSSREDDEVSASLRACQRLLQRQTLLNEARKSVLSSIVKDRMAYQDYETIRDAQERVIETGWTKRQRAGKKKGKGKEKDKTSEGPKPPVSLSLLSAVEKRHRLVSLFRPFFEEEEDKGKFWGIPETSVYEGMVVEGLEDEEGFQLE